MKNTVKEFVKLDRRLEDAKERLELSATPEAQIRMSNIQYNLAFQALLSASSGGASSLEVGERIAHAIAKIEAYERAVERLFKKT